MTSRRRPPRTADVSLNRSHAHWRNAGGVCLAGRMRHHDLVVIGAGSGNALVDSFAIWTWPQSGSAGSEEPA